MITPQPTPTATTPLARSTSSTPGRGAVHTATVPAEQAEAEVLSNQTTFFESEVMQQAPPTMPVELDPQHAEKELLRKKRQRLMILAGTLVTVVLLFLTAVLILVAPEARPRLDVVPSPIVLQRDPQETILTQRLAELERDLRAADPIVVDVSFPPLNMTNLFLDRPPR